MHFGEFGEGAGQMRAPLGVAADASGNAYVSDAENQRIDEFDSAGDFVLAWGVGVVDGGHGVETCTSPCKSGVAGGTDSFEFPAGVATDASGDVYVVDYGHFRVEKFGPNHEFLLMIGGKVNRSTGANLCTKESECGPSAETIGGGFDGEFSFWNYLTNFIAVGGSGEDLYVGDTARVQVFSPAGTWLKNISLAALSSSGQPETLAVDQAGDLFVKDGGVPGVRELEPNGTVKSVEFDEGSNTITGVAVDSTHNRLYVGDSAGGFHILEYDSATGQQLEDFGAKTVGNDTSFGIAFSTLQASVYATDLERSAVWSLPVPAPGPFITSESATPAVHRAATLSATINSENSETTYHFEYVGQADYEANGFAKALSTTSATLPASFSEQSVSATLASLTAGETYRWRVVATNADGAATVEGQPFEEIPAATAEGPWATAVTGESATLSAKVASQQNVSTEYRLEYGTDASYGHVAFEGRLEAGEGSVSVNRHLQGLQSATTYHYRIVVHNEFGTVESVDKTLTTQFSYTGSVLPDSRSWELVSPADKRGALIENQDDAYDVQAAASGDGIAYVASEPMTSGAAGRPWSFQGVVSHRGPTGWSSEEVGVPSELQPEMSSALLGKKSTLPPPLFSADLSHAIVSPGLLAPLLSAEATEQSLYLRNNQICGPRPDACYTPLVTASDVPPGTVWGNKTPEAIGMQFLSASLDLSHIVFEHPAALTLEANSYPLTCAICKPLENLFEWGDGKLQLVNAFGSGAGRVATPAGEEVFLGGPEENETVGQAVSHDGRRIVWSRKPSDRETIFEVRDMVEEKTVQIGRLGALFQTMSADGSRIFFLENGDLYMLDFDTGAQTDLTGEHGPGEQSARVQNDVIGASEDGKSIYFVAKGVLTSDASGSDDNLYLAQEEAGAWKIALVARLSSEDEKDWAAHFFVGQAIDRSRVTSRLSPNGRFLAFMSNRSLTGYDNADVNSGQPDEEVYVYDAQSGRLACASCKPTGARPAGIFYAGHIPLIDRRGSWRNRWFAANLPGWNSAEGNLSLYQPRFLSDNGRTFFQSSDALVPQDTNGLADVYEYEPPGVPGAGGCTSRSVTFSASSDGCVSLISSGTSDSESAFYDASESGDDAFFVTTGRLTPADRDSSFDVYDAHVCSAGAPCLSSQPPPSQCATADACRAAPEPQPESFGPPPSATFSGAGNVSNRAAKHVSTSSTRAQRLSQALRRCRKRHATHSGRRRRCEQRAIRQSAAHGARKSKSTGRGNR